MLYFSVFELFSGWVLLAKLFICTTPIGYFKMSPYYCGPKGNEENAYAPFFMRGGGGGVGGWAGDNTAQPFFKGKALGTRLGSDEGLWRICRLYLVIYT